MRKIISLIALIVSIHSVTAKTTHLLPIFEVNQDSVRTAELDQYWEALSKTVAEGDFEDYAAAYHPDAVIVFAT